jgi:hypothetical protein
MLKVSALSIVLIIKLPFGKIPLAVASRYNLKGNNKIKLYESLKASQSGMVRSDFRSFINFPSGII